VEKEKLKSKNGYARREREFICQVHNIDNRPTYKLSGVSVNSSGNPWSTSIGPTAFFGEHRSSNIITFSAREGREHAGVETGQSA